MPYTDPILLTGDMIAWLATGPTNHGNPGDADFGMNLSGVEALAGADTLYRLNWYQNIDGSAEEMLNGQFWRLEIYDPGADPDGDPATGDAGWSLAPGGDQLVPKSDLVSGLGGGDDYIVLEGPGGWLLYDLNGGLPATPTDMTYYAADENGAAGVGDDDGQLDFQDAYAAICFAADTLIDTPGGPRPVETLAVGDLVETLDHGAQPLRWIGKRAYDRAVLEAARTLWPIRIAQGALGAGVPVHDLLLSPQHRVLIRSPVAARMLGAREVLVAARHLVAMPGIREARGVRGVEYVHLLLDRHEVVFANGAAAESLFLGAMALRMVASGDRDEIAVVFPDLTCPGPLRRMAPARIIVPGRQARSLVRRLKGNGKPLAGVGARVPA